MAILGLGATLELVVRNVGTTTIPAKRACVFNEGTGTGILTGISSAFPDAGATQSIGFLAEVTPVIGHGSGTGLGTGLTTESFAGVTISAMKPGASGVIIAKGPAIIEIVTGATLPLGAATTVYNDNDTNAERLGMAIAFASSTFALGTVICEEFSITSFDFTGSPKYYVIVNLTGNV